MAVEILGKWKFSFHTFLNSVKSVHFNWLIWVLSLFHCFNNYICQEQQLYPRQRMSACFTSKGKVIPIHAIKLYRLSGSTSSLFLNLSTWWKWVVSLMPQPLLPHVKSLSTHCIGSWVGLIPNQDYLRTEEVCFVFMKCSKWLHLVEDIHGLCSSICLPDLKCKLMNLIKWYIRKRKW